MRSLYFGQTVASSSLAGGGITGVAWEMESAGGGSNRGKHLIASVHEVGLLVLRSMPSTCHRKPENKDRQKRWSVKGL